MEWEIAPAIDLAEKEDSYEITAELPGINEKNVDITLSNHTLTIKGEKSEDKEEERKDYYMSERRYGSFKRSLQIPEGVDPDKIRAAFRAHVRARVPADCSVEFIEHGGSRAISVPTTGKYLQQARAALADEWGRQAALRASGGSIPVAGDFKRILGLDTLLIGYANADDRIHSPNEKYNLRSYEKGIRSWIRVLAAFAA